MRFLIIFCPTATTFISNSRHNHNVAKELSPEIGVSSQLARCPLGFLVSDVRKWDIPFRAVDPNIASLVEFKSHLDLLELSSNSKLDRKWKQQGMFGGISWYKTTSHRELVPDNFQVQENYRIMMIIILRSWMTGIILAEWVIIVSIQYNDSLVFSHLHMNHFSSTVAKFW